jgi:ribonucleoside-diphosphate reductase alpha chain
MSEAGPGLKIPRRFTREGEDPFESVEWDRRDSRITNPDGSIVFEMTDAEIPADWSQVATDIIVSKYFRKAGVPELDAEGNPVLDWEGKPVLGPERSARQTIGRLAGTWRRWGEKGGYFASSEDADAFEDELNYMLVHQMASPNSPQWFNTGLHDAYGLTGPAQGFWYVDPETGAAVESPDSYSRPAPHACFIQSVGDDLVNDGGIMDLWMREARLFKFGSGTGTNFSSIRGEGEPLSGGGKSSGVMSFLKIGDRAAGAIKSGGTTRRAAKMVILDLDHPDIEEFISWKAEEEKKVRALIAAGYPSDFNGDAYQTVSGQNSNNSVRIPNDFVSAVINDEYWELTRRTDGETVKKIRARELWSKIAEAAWACADPGVQFDTTINEWHTSPAEGPIRASNPCFTGDTRIATDKGLIQFKDLIDRVSQGESFEVYTHNATSESPAESVQLSRPTQFMVTGVNEIVRLEFSDGRVVRATPNHRFWTRNRGWVRADELSHDDHVRILDKPIDFGMASWAMPVSTDPADHQAWSTRKYAVNLPEKWNEDFAHYLGWLVGDGSLTNEAAVTIYGTGEEQQTTMISHQKLLTEMNGGFAPKPTRMKNGTYQLRVTRGAIREFIRALGVTSARSDRKRLPWSIFEAPKAIVAVFLQGLFDADGCVSSTANKTRYVGLASASIGLLRDVQQLLDTFGLSARIYRTRASSPSGFKYTTVGGEDRTYQSSEMYDLRITGSDVENFAAYVGFGVDYKAKALNTILTEATRYRSKQWTTLSSRLEDGFETTYNLTEPRNHSYLAGGVLVSNCSEYLFLDNTACNLASLNLVKFYDDEEQYFDIDAYLHAIRLWTIVLETSVTMAHFPSREIAQGSYDYRTLGLGYANLGSLLMRTGIPYDSDEGRAIAGTLTAIMTGHSYATSAEMARALGPFTKFDINRDSMMRVIRNHRRAAFDVPDNEYEGVSHFVMGIDEELAPADLLQTARAVWDNALHMGEEHGFRNAQVSVLAPTGTIGLQMDCDTTGVEPDFALVKFKKLAGGGYFKIANQSIAPALRHLGYQPDQIEEIVDYVVGTMTLLGAPGVNRASLTSKGFTPEDLVNIEKTLPGVFELKHAFNVFVLGEETLARLGFTEDQYTSMDFDLLTALGYTADEVHAANDFICGRQTIEGAPFLQDEHLPVFDTANKNGRYGKRFIHHIGHIKMMAAAQPFITGAISKTINMPNDVSTSDIEEAYMLSWELGLKAMALYRDGSKASQPLSATSDEGEHPDDEAEGLPEALEEEARIAKGVVEAVSFAPGVSPTQAYEGMARPRFLLPARRTGFTQEARVGGHKLFIRTGEYDDGSLGELFIDLAKEGATLRGVLSCFAIAVSKGLQYGVPLEEYVDTFTFQTFEPRGMVEGHPNIKMANSIVDYVFRALGMEYLDRHDLVQVPPTEVRSLPEPPTGIAAQSGQQLELAESQMEDDIEVQARAAAFVDAPDAPAKGNGNGHAQPVELRASTTAVAGGDAQTSSVQAALASNMGDAPLCDTCGHITVRNGSCYRCLNCGDSKGCS